MTLLGAGRALLGPLPCCVEQPLLALRSAASRRRCCSSGTSARQATAAGSSPAAAPAVAPQQQRPAVQPTASALELEPLPFYSQFPLDRREELRKDAKALAELFERPDARLLPVSQRGAVLVRPLAAVATAAQAQAAAPAAGVPDWPQGDTVTLQLELLCPAAAHAELVAPSPARVFLGIDALGAPYFAAEVTRAAAESLAATHPGAEWRAARAAGPDLDAGEASLAAVASGLLAWHAATGFSAATGAPTAPSPGGYSRKCSQSGSSAYPRIDPAVIMLVTSPCQAFCLLGRKAEWPQGR